MKVEVISRFEVGDNVSILGWRYTTGTIIRVTWAEDEHIFKYLVEVPNGVRNWLNERQLVSNNVE